LSDFADYDIFTNLVFERNMGYNEIIEIGGMFMKLARTLLVVLIVLGLVFVFLEGRENDQRQAANGNNAEIVTEKPEGSEETPNDGEKGNEVSETPENPDTPVANEELKGKAIYLGRIDNNSIEVKEGDNYVAYRLAPQIQENFDNLNLEEKGWIEFTYYINEHGQRVMTEIKKIP